MVPIRSDFLLKISDLHYTNQTSNGTYPARPKISAEICRGAEV